MTAPKLWGVGEIAEALGRDVELIRKWRERGKLPEPTAKLGRGYVWQGPEIEAWIAAHQPASNGAKP